MRMNRLLADIANSPDEFGEWPYFVSIFGDPASGEPWGWQIDGHHLCLNCTVVDDQVVLTPAFMGCRTVAASSTARRPARCCSAPRNEAGST